MAILTFACGCEFKTSSENSDDARQEIRKTLFRPDIGEIPLDCERTWDLISSGNTKGCFQLESRLGQSLAKKTRPRNIEELAGLISIMRPGCMEAIVEGKSLTNHYIDRKHGRESVEYFHPALERSLKETFGILVYQEQSMQIAQEIAGFNLQEADILRKAIGKKKTDVMAQVKTSFLQKAEEKGIVTKEQAEEIFSWIEKSQRYSFNKSHAVSYAFNAYLSAYAKAHFSKEFFTSYLYYSKEKQKPHEEINELVNNCRVMNIEIFPPDLRKSNKNFKIIDEKIFFGLSNVKSVGQAVIDKIKRHKDEVEKTLNKEIDAWCWREFLVFFSDKITSTAVKALISVGAMSYMSSNRTKMLYEYELFQKLTNKEKGWIQNHLLENPDERDKEFLEILKHVVSLPTGKQGAVANKKRLESVKGMVMSLESPPYKLEDMPEWVAGKEEHLLGIPLTCSKVDACDTSSANAICKDVINKNIKDYPLIAVQVDAVREIQIKNGPNRGAKMAFSTVSDYSCAIDCVIFSDAWEEYKNLLFEGNTVMINGELDRAKESFMIKKVWQI